MVVRERGIASPNRHHTKPRNLRSLGMDGVNPEVDGTFPEFHWKRID